MSVQKHKPVWRSFYGHFVMMGVCVAVVLVTSLKLDLDPAYQKWLWLALLIALVGLAVSMAYRRQSVTLIVKPDEIALEKGFLRRHSTEIDIRDIRTIQVNQSIMQRILNIGDISVASSGTDGYEIFAGNVPNPSAIRETIQAYQRSGKKQKGGKT